MDREIHATSTKQGRIGRIHNGVGNFFDDVSRPVNLHRLSTLKHEADCVTCHGSVQNAHFLSVSASTPGSFFPSRNSSDAPPPVEMCVILSATPAACTAATESPTPTIE